MLAFQPDERIAQVIALRDYGVAPYLVLATRNGPGQEDRPDASTTTRSSGLIADQPARGRRAHRRRADLRRRRPAAGQPPAQSIRFRADDDALRPMGRATSGVTGMRLGDGDELLAMEVAGRRRRGDDGAARRDRRRLRQAHRVAEYRSRAAAATACSRPGSRRSAGSWSGPRGARRRRGLRDHERRRRHPDGGRRAPLLSRATGGVKLMALDGGATVVGVAHNGEAESEVDQALEVGAEAVPAEVLARGRASGGRRRRSGTVVQDVPTEPEDSGPEEPVDALEDEARRRARRRRGRGAGMPSRREPRGPRAADGPRDTAPTSVAPDVRGAQWPGQVTDDSAAGPSPAGASAPRPDGPPGAPRGPEAGGRRRRARLAVSAGPLVGLRDGAAAEHLLGIVLIVAVGVLYALLDSLGVLGSVNDVARAGPGRRG